MRLVIMISSRSVNQPFGLNQVRVCVGDGGILKKVMKPTVRVIIASIKNSHLHPEEEHLGREAD